MDTADAANNFFFRHIDRRNKHRNLKLGKNLRQ
jgi:hypothetical protein